MLRETQSQGDVAALTTIVLTRGRTVLLDRAIRSLQRQRDVAIDLLVIVDDCPDTARHVSSARLASGCVRSVRRLHAGRADGERSGPKRLARLRELGLGVVATRWCAFLDDDNELEPAHYRTLLACMEAHGAQVAHSWRTLWTRDGRPHPLTCVHPWCRDPDLARRLFAQYEDAGIYRVGSNVIRDQVVPGCRERSMVDTSEWLFETTLLRGIGFARDYSRGDWLASRSEDSKLLDEVVRRGMTVPCTGKATLRYFLGGYSNDWSAEAAQLTGWL